ncbi:LacI family DNA-binding transcriptional regulator [Xenorhabdus bovienii]|uniref:LacI family DNA-binding transcriptional regulator n=1 Tax=Xenorhabdus bovienii TaxID=40576 RepID=UPI0004D3DD39|nr:LacI family DNA-binding transcriptional regulator [Xenorhabdus bovienii]CDG88616.1 putative LacI-family transcriptional regulator (transcriptional regulator) [Xenorhabdus bovienii str. feltiae France]CDG94778.1 putative LacI-family transcriptional regulator (transcriptional regulator) [Xenorhabdus bovienii str. feltiae Florida]
MITLEDVASYSGVSRATVSRVVNGDKKVKAATRTKVENAIVELGYSPNLAARELASNQSNTLGLVTTSYRGGFFGALMDSIQTEAESHGKQLLVMQGRNRAENEWQAIMHLHSLRCGGMILHVRAISDDKLRQLAQNGRSFVLLDRLVAGLEPRCVVFDHHKASYLATQTLVEHGHTRIACVSGPLSRNPSQQRRQGFLDAMQDAGLNPVACLEGEYDLQSGYRQTRTILAKSRPDALFFCSEEMALGALLAITELGLCVPEDISIICYDSGERAAFVYPALTSVHFPITDMACFATRLLIEPDTPPPEFTPQIIYRNSLRQSK